MTSWAALQSHIRGNYNVTSERDGQLAVVFEFDNGRTQQASIDLESLVDHEWVCITSAFGEVGQVDLSEALEVVNSRIFGAIGRTGQYYVVKHSALLSDMSAEELEYPLLLTLGLADELEKKVGMGDRF